MEQVQALVELIILIDNRNTYIPPEYARILRQHGFQPHHSYLRPPRPPPPPPRPRCPSITHSGTQCTNKCAVDKATCMVHCDNPTPRPVPHELYRCTATTGAGEQCKCGRYKHFSLCWRHARKENLLPPPPEVPVDCAICYCELSTGQKVKTMCNHYFHESCFDTWKNSRIAVRQAVTCPMCRQFNPKPKKIT